MARTACIALCALALAGCESSTSVFGPGLDQQVRVRGGQLVTGPIADPGCTPETSPNCGPAVTSIARNQASVERGDGTVIVTGRLGPGGTALHVWAEGDPHHWVALPEAFDFIQPDELSYSIELEFSFAIQGETLNVHMQAADDQGRLGPVTVSEFTILPDVPPAELLVSLGWDGHADLDLHVELPDGTIVGAKNINSNVPSGNPADLSWMYGGFLDHDSNQECRFDAINRENVVWLKREGDPRQCRRRRGTTRCTQICSRPAARARSTSRQSLSSTAKSFSAVRAACTSSTLVFIHQTKRRQVSC